MQTIEEYKAYTKQLENEVGTWHHAYDALLIERNNLVKELMKLKNEFKHKNDIKPIFDAGIIRDGIGL